MLETYFEAAATLRRLRSGPTGPYIDDFAASLDDAGYSRWTARGCLRAGAHLGVWMQTAGIYISDLGDVALSGFVEHLPTCTCLRRNKGQYSDAASGARLFMDHLASRAMIPRMSTPAHKIVPGALARFEHWMLHHRGVKASTLASYRPILVELHDQFSDTADFTARSLRKFVSARAARHGRGRAKTTVTAVRMYLRYAVAHGLCASNLTDSIPTVAEWRLSALPAYIAPAAVERVIEATDVTAPSGLRDRAILLLLARLGLRAGDITAMRLEDVDWDAGILHVAGKTRQATRLPLPQDVGDAVLAYLADGRPNASDPHLFLRLRAPVGRLRTSNSISSVVNRAANRAKIQMPRGGAHVLRHSIATALVRDGVPLSAIGALLRHRSEQTTAHYAKVDLPALLRVAQPWPTEVSPC